MYHSKWDFVQPKLSSAFYIKTPRNENVKQLSSVYCLFSLCVCIGNIHCRAAYILFNSVLNIINCIKCFKFSAERFLSYSPSPVISICLSDSLFLLACVSVSVCLFISSVSVFFWFGGKNSIKRVFNCLLQRLSFNVSTLLFG